MAKRWSVRYGIRADRHELAVCDEGDATYVRKTDEEWVISQMKSLRHAIGMIRYFGEMFLADDRCLPNRKITIWLG